jgi:hypothetical protein
VIFKLNLIELIEKQPTTNGLLNLNWLALNLKSIFLQSIFPRSKNYKGQIEMQIQTCKLIQNHRWENGEWFYSASACSMRRKAHPKCIVNIVQMKLGLWCTELPLGGWRATRQMTFKSLCWPKSINKFPSCSFFLMGFNEHARSHCLIFKQMLLCGDNKPVLHCIELLIYSSMDDCHSC